MVWACTAADAENRRAALDPDNSVQTALALCRRSEDDADACVAELARLRDDLPATACTRILEPRWSAECHFAIAERAAKDGDRWEALALCGQAGDYYHECLYHSWTFEIQSGAQGLGSAVAGLERGRAIVAFWSQLQTIGPDAPTQLWNDWWYFAHARNRPAVLAACGSLPDKRDQARCEVGTRLYVRRSIVEALIRPSLPPEHRDRMCRGGHAEAKMILGDLYSADPVLDEEADAAIAAACLPEGSRAARPWNPVFRAKRGAG